MTYEEEIKNDSDLASEARYNEMLERAAEWRRNNKYKYSSTSTTIMLAVLNCVSLAIFILSIIFVAKPDWAYNPMGELNDIFIKLITITTITALVLFFSYRYVFTLVGKTKMNVGFLSFIQWVRSMVAILVVSIFTFVIFLSFFIILTEPVISGEVTLIIISWIAIPVSAYYITGYY